MKSIVYLDNMRTTRPDPDVIKEMNKYMEEIYSAPGGEFGHSMEEQATEAVERAREVVARKLGAQPKEIVFTSGRVESNNLAIKGAAGARPGAGSFLSSRIEESSVLRTLEKLKKSGLDVSFIGVDGEGFIRLDELNEKARGAKLVSIQHVNQEIGTIQDLRAIGEICRDGGALFHCDASWGFMKEEMNVEKTQVDLLTGSSQLIHGPKGVGFLYIRDGVKLEPLLDGAPREFGIRPGMDDVPGIVGFAKAVEKMEDVDVDRIRGMRDELMDALLDIPHTKLNGPRGDRRVCNDVNVSFKGVEGESILMRSSAVGLMFSSGSACYSPELQPSHVILAIGGSFEDSHGSVTLGLSKWTERSEIEFAYETLRGTVEDLRSISPMWRQG